MHQKKRLTPSQNRSPDPRRIARRSAHHPIKAPPIPRALREPAAHSTRSILMPQTPHDRPIRLALVLGEDQPIFSRLFQIAVERRIHGVGHHLLFDR